MMTFGVLLGLPKKTIYADSNFQSFSLSVGVSLNVIPKWFRENIFFRCLNQLTLLRTVLTWVAWDPARHFNQLTSGQNLMFVFVQVLIAKNNIGSCKREKVGGLIIRSINPRTKNHHCNFARQWRQVDYTVSLYFRVESCCSSAVDFVRKIAIIKIESGKTEKSWGASFSTRPNQEPNDISRSIFTVAPHIITLNDLFNFPTQ